MQELITICILTIISFISLFIPHKSKKYALSWWSRLLFSITYIYILGCIMCLIIFIVKYLIK